MHRNHISGWQAILCHAGGIIIILLFSFLPEIQAKHIIGGEITYTFLQFNADSSEVTYRITVHIYRDCFGGGAAFDQRFNFGLYRYDQSQNMWDYYFVNGINGVRLRSVEKLTPRLDSCAIVPNNVCVEKGTYYFNITVPISNTPYMIAYQRCCRNESISNIPNPGRWGAAYTVEISPEAQRLGNSSPTFKSFPPLVICKDFALDFDHSAVDDEGDNLVYEFCSPLHAGGQRDVRGGRCNPNANPPQCDCVTPFPEVCVPPFDLVPFKNNYSPQFPLAGNPKVTINPITGQITGVPKLSGQFVVGVCVKEYRNGVLLSKVRRDFQFNVTDCEPTVVAKIDRSVPVGENTVQLESCGENTLDILNKSYLRNYIYNFKWEFDFKNSVQTFNTWDVRVTFPDTGTFRGKLVLNEGLKCIDSTNIIVKIHPSIEADFSNSYDTCSPTPVQFTDESVSGSGKITDWDWDFGDQGEDKVPHPAHQYEAPGTYRVFLRVKDVNNCTDVIEQEVPWYPAPEIIVVNPSQFEGCAPGNIFFENLSSPIDETYFVEWDFGDGDTARAISPNHLYEEPGTYTVRVRITSPIGCTIEDVYTDLIHIQDGPIADFDYTPKRVTNIVNKVKFSNISTRSVAWQWIIDSRDVLYEFEPEYIFGDTGVHEVKLIAIHENGCTDTIIKYIDVVPQDKYIMPNAFTPNGDGTNDYFRGIGYEGGIRDFKFQIWDRWGALVFETDQIDEGWDGTLQNEGKPLPAGVYLYIVSYTASRGQKRVLKGYAALVR